MSTASPADLTPAEESIARSVLYAALFDYPLTLAQLRQTLIGSPQTPSEIVGPTVRVQRLAGYRRAAGWLTSFPPAAATWSQHADVGKLRSRAFLLEHRPLLRLIAALPYVKLVALSGSIAHLNLENGGDLDLFIVTRGRRVWSTAVAVDLLARLLRRRRTLCANFIVADTALAFEQQDLFTASQIDQPEAGRRRRRVPRASSTRTRSCASSTRISTRPTAATSRLRQSRWPASLKAIVETSLLVPSAFVERVCRGHTGPI